MISFGISIPIRTTFVKNTKWEWTREIWTKALKKEQRYWGYRLDWYDGPIYCFGLWLIFVATMEAATPIRLNNTQMEE